MQIFESVLEFSSNFLLKISGLLSNSGEDWSTKSSFVPSLPRTITRRSSHVQTRGQLATRLYEYTSKAIPNMFCPCSSEWIM